MSYFDYHLPKEKIAQWPRGFEGERSDARLLWGRAIQGGLEIDDLGFTEIVDVLNSGDLLILNDTKVRPVRLFGKFGEREHEVLLLNKEESGFWRCLVKNLKKLKVDDLIVFDQDLSARLVDRLDAEALLEFSADDEEIFQKGLMPIPPYIREGRSEKQDRSLYQTVFAKNEGSIAAPTAGFHFTEELLAKLQSKDIEVDYLTLHVGSASFLPIRGESQDYNMPYESYSVSFKLAEKIRKVKGRGNRIAVVGTTSTRAIESYWRLEQQSEEFQQTNLFIKPGFDFKVVDVLVTNFHQPKTTHLCLVAAFIGEENLEKIYQHALARDYMFLSYGDSMILEHG